MRESTKMQEVQENRWQEGIDSKALFACYIRKLPALLVLAVAGALVGSGLSLLSAYIVSRTPVYISETEYYIDFAEGRLDAKDYYNDFTWNDVIATDLILGKAMDILGSGFEREQVKKMITADILSDVRFLTITIKGEDEEVVGKVRDALHVALEAYGEIKNDLFDAITKIEDLGIVQEKHSLFAWRAALLGAFVAAGIGIFITAFWFAMGTCVYTKMDIVKYFGIPVYGMLYTKGNRIEGKQEKRLLSCLNTILDKGESVYLADAAEGATAAKFLNKLEELGQSFSHGRLEVFAELRCQSNAEVILIVPFGVPCREKITDEIMYLKQQEYQVIGAILVEVDKRWTDIYWK